MSGGDFRLFGEQVALAVFVLQEQLVILRRGEKRRLGPGNFVVEHDIQSLDTHRGEIFLDGAADFVQTHGRGHIETEVLKDLFLLFQFEPLVGLVTLREFAHQHTRLLEQVLGL